MRVHRYLCRHAVPVQYSVFTTPASPMNLGVVQARLASILDADTDDVRIYPLPEPANLVVLGRKLLPDGLQIIEGDSTLAPA